MVQIRGTSAHGGTPSAGLTPAGGLPRYHSPRYINFYSLKIVVILPRAQSNPLPQKEFDLRLLPLFVQLGTLLEDDDSAGWR